MTRYQLVLIVMGALLGSSVGSFAGVVVWRIPRHQSLLRPPSYCAACGDLIPAWANMPILAWPLLRGRCHQCGAHIGVTSWLLEMWCGGVTAAALALVGLDRWWVWPMILAAWVVPTAILIMVENRRVTIN